MSDMGHADTSRRTMVDSYTVTIIRRSRFGYEWSVEGPYRGRVRRGFAVTHGRARRQALRMIWEPVFGWFERRERTECQIVERRSMVLSKDPEPLEKELIA